MNIERMIIKLQETMLTRYRESVEDYLNTFPHGWFVTLSFEGDEYSAPIAESIRDAGLRKAKSWLIWLSRTHSAHLIPFESAEPTFTGKRFSIHMVLLSDQKIKVNDLKSAWRYGNTVIKTYKHDLGGIEYTYTNHIGIESWIICPAKKPCRKNRKGHIFCIYDEHRRLII